MYTMYLCTKIYSNREVEKLFYMYNFAGQPTVQRPKTMKLTHELRRRLLYFITGEIIFKAALVSRMRV